MKKTLLGTVVWLMGVLLVGIAHAGHVLPVPEDHVVLKVSGNITHTNVGDEAHFDYAMLAELPQHQYTTGTPWTRLPFHYRGPLMRDLLAYLEADSKHVRVSALNGYEAYIPIRDFSEFDVMLAMKRNGEPISIREYGPLWVLYPFDRHTELWNESFRSRAVWQVMKIDVH